MSEVLGVIIVARNGDRYEYYQDPQNYNGAATETTALGVAQSFQLGAELRSIYLSSSSPSFVKGLSSELMDTSEVKARVKAGGEGTVAFDSAIALFQGLYPPTPKNKITLANDSVVVAPLGGYQYVPVETVEPGNDRSLESWTSCPAFEKHVAEFRASDQFKNIEKQAEPFFKVIKDYVFGRPTTLENIWNIYDFINSELTHNKTYAYRLPPTYIEQARHFANLHEDGIFSDKDINGVGNIPGRTLLHTILSSLQRIALDGDPLQFLLVQTTYQPFISFFHQTDVVKSYPHLKGIPDFTSALAIELRRGSPPELRDFLRFKFKNGTSSDWDTVHVFGHRADIPLTEFIYRIENAAITSNHEWARACNVKSATSAGSFLEAAKNTAVQSSFAGVFAFFLLCGLFVISRLVQRSRVRAREARLRLEGDENVPIIEKRRFI